VSPTIREFFRLQKTPRRQHRLFELIVSWAKSITLKNYNSEKIYNAGGLHLISVKTAVQMIERIKEGWSVPVGSNPYDIIEREISFVIKEVK
jgi:hypothetical protein